MSKKSDISVSDRAHISFDALRMKQSVRTTFKLPKEIIDLLGLIAGQLGIKQKSLLDQLAADTRILDRLAEEASAATEVERYRHPKTYVISRSSLHSINAVAKRQNIPRDILVEVLIKRLLPIIETELARHIERKKILEKMKDHMQHVAALRNQAREVLGEDDELYLMIDKEAGLAEKNIVAANTVVEKGVPMEEWRKVTLTAASPFACKDENRGYITQRLTMDCSEQSWN